jgi:hypothetical protein
MLARYGRGEPVAHQGGRYLWPIAEHDSLRVAWKLDPRPARHRDLGRAGRGAEGFLDLEGLL